MWKQMSACEKDALTSGAELTFRATAFRVGRDDAKQAYTSDQLAIAVGGGVNNAMRWKAKMSAYDLEVIVNVADDELCVGIALRDYAPSVRSSL